MTVITAELEIRLLAMNLERAERALEELSKREHDRRKELHSEGGGVTVADDLATLHAACDGIARREAALKRVEAKIARLIEQIAYLESDAALVAAEAETARLRDGLRRITREPWCGCQSCACRRRSRALLAEDGAA